MDDPGAFSFVEYLSIFTATIYGYVATRFFSGWSAMINFRKQIVVSYEMISWTLLTFGLLIDVWWGSWLKFIGMENHVFLYYLSLISPLIFYIISVIFFPPLAGDLFVDFRRHFRNNRKRIYAGYIALFLSFQAGSLFFADPYEKDIYFNLLAIAMLSAGLVCRSKTFDVLLLFAGWSLLIAHVILQPPMDRTMEILDNFSFTEYLTVFVAFIYGFVASRFFSGWGVLITRLDGIRLSRDHIGWTLLAFVLLLDLWIGSWFREAYISRGVLHFMLSLSTPLAFCLLGAVTFPVMRSGENPDMNEYFFANRYSIILMFGCVLAINAVVANCMEEESWHSTENGFRFVSLLLIGIALMARRLWWERLTLAVGWILLVTHILFESQVL